MDFGRCRHNYEGFYEKSAYQISINRGRMTTTRGFHVPPVSHFLHQHELDIDTLLHLLMTTRDMATLSHS